MVASSSQNCFNFGGCFHNIGGVLAPGFSQVLPVARASVLDVLRLTERDNRSSRKESLRLRLQNIFSNFIRINKILLFQTLKNFPEIISLNKFAEVYM